MKLRRFRIEKLRGIDRAYGLDDLGDGLTVIVGRNASGKSSIVRALRALVDRDFAREGVSVEATFVDERGRRIVGSRLGTSIEWRADGRTIDAPPFPTREVLDCYLIRLEDLFLPSGPAGVDAELGRRLRRALAGGFDLEAVAGELYGRVRLRHGDAERKALRAARERRTQIERRHREISGAEERLPELEREIEAARAERLVVESAGAALECLSARAELAEVLRELDRLPAGMGRIREELASDLDAARRERNAKEAALEEAERRCGSVRDALAGELYRSLRVDRAAVDGAEARLRALEDAQHEREEAEREVAEKQNACDRALADLRPLRPADELGISIPDIDRIAEYAARLGELRRELAAATDRHAREQALAEARRLDMRVVVFAALPGVIAVVAAGWLAFTGELAAARILAVAGAVGALGAYGAWRTSRTADTLARQQMEEQARIERELGEAEAALSAALRTAGIEPSAAAADTGAEQVGLALRTKEAAEVWLRRLRDVEHARASLAEARGRLERARQRVREARQALSDHLASCGLACGPVPEATAVDGSWSAASSEALTDGVRRLRSYWEEFANLQRERRQLDDTLGTLRRDLERIDERIAGVFERAGLETGDEHGLRSRIQALPVWETLRERERKARIRAEQADARVTSREVRALLEREDPDAIKQRRMEAEERAAGLEGLIAKRAGFKQSIEDARGGTALEDARAAEQKAREQLAERRDEAVRAAAGRFLLAAVTAAHESEARPRELERACDWFGRFTRHAFELLPPGRDDASMFRARDTKTGEQRLLSELSSGTRAQLLLAVRLAFLEELEAAYTPLPVFLDEALTTSDPERFRAVAEALAMVASERDRQIVYLTAEPEDAAKFKAVASSTPVVDLDAVRGDERAISDPAAITPPRIATPPAPDGRSPEEYARMLGVEPIDIHAGLDAIPAFYLLRDDLELLRRLLVRGLGHVGAVRTWLDSREAAGGEFASALPRLRRRIRAAEAFLEAARVGRARPVKQEHLEAAEISETFLPRVREVLAEVAGDGRRLLDRIDAKSDERLKGFRSNARERLEEVLRDAGCLEEAETLSPQAIFGRVLRRIGVQAGESEEEWKHFVAGLLGGARLDREDAKVPQRRAGGERFG